MRILAVPLVVLLALFTGCSAPSAEQAQAASKKPGEVSKQSVDSGVLTVENSSQLKAVLSGPATGKAVNAFSEQQLGELIQFDGIVTDVYINPREHNGESTISVRASGRGSKPTGPVFELGWYGHDSPMEKFVKGDEVRAKALVGIVYEFDPYQFFLIEAEGVDALTRR